MPSHVFFSPDTGRVHHHLAQLARLWCVRHAAAVNRARAFFAMAPKLLTDLPADVVQHIVVRLTLAHHIARIAPTCKVVSVAARNAIRVRQFSSEVVASAS